MYELALFLAYRGRGEEKEMKRILLLMVGLALLFSVSSACAQAGNTQLYFNGVYQGNNWFTGPEGGVGTGFYDGSINNVNVGPGQTSPGMICDDYYDNVTAGEHWTATGYQVSALNAGNISSMLFGGANWNAVVSGWTALQGYQALAYLANDMFTHAIGNSSLQSSISQALWYLTSAAIGRGFSLLSLDSQAQALVAYVKNLANDPALSTYANLYLYTQPFNPNGPQEMWGQVPIAVPDGGAALMYLLLAGSTCFGAMFYSRRRAGVGGLA
jgi:hypothetical protein